mmetsp:Transcript_2922/g.5474  ORF Transcript_2922/g.5474 Transcript_2922/m.5474 type:complete len:290 (+) Transcript_2922:163-1032(+)
MSSTSSDEVDQTDAIRNQGRVNGLFRACMDAIRLPHTIGQTLRNGALAAGLLTDRNCYAELLGQFYIATAALEKRIDELLLVDSNDGRKDDQEQIHQKNRLVLLRKVNELGYRFTKGYERDLEFLLGSDQWKKVLNSWTTEPAKDYARELEVADETKLIAAAFILWGPLVIGGGAALKPRVEKSFGSGATHVFKDVTGSSGGGRSGRRRKFIEVLDQLLDSDDTMTDEEKKEVFESIVLHTGKFMAKNNDMMMAVRQRPWFTKYIWSGLAAVLAVIVWNFTAARRETSK